MSIFGVLKSKRPEQTNPKHEKPLAYPVCWNGIRDNVIGFEYFLGKLYTKEGRDAVIAHAVRKGITNEPRYVEIAVNYFTMIDYIRRADVDVDKLWKDMGYDEKSDEVYEKLLEYVKDRRFESAIELTRKELGGEEANKITELAFQIAEKEQHFEFARRLAQDNGDAERAGIYRAVISLNPFWDIDFDDGPFT